MSPAVSVADFDYVRRLVYEHSAIALDHTKDYLVDARLAPVAEREGLESVAALVRSLRTGGTRLRDEVIAAMATNETTFFRDVHPFDVLGDIVIPEVLRANGGASLTMWSGAASTGQEAYSMAMVVRERFPSIPNVRILGTDLSDDVLERARTGRFPQLEINRGLPTRLLVKYFTRDGAAWQLSDPIRQMVSFRRMNLARPFEGLPLLDVIFLRNVLIYFDTSTKIEVLRRVVQVLRPGGYLFLGGAETTYGINDSFQRVYAGKTVYYRLDHQEEPR